MNNSGRPQGPSGDGSRRPFPRHSGGRHSPSQRASAQRQGSGQNSQGTQSAPAAQNNQNNQNNQARPHREAPPPVLRKEDFKRPPVNEDCVLCGKPLFDLAGALADKDTGKPVHFDCALEKVQASEQLAEGEHIAYLGAGCFGVVSYRNGKDGAFTVLRRIRWEREGEKQPWRKDISSYITKI